MIVYLDNNYICHTKNNGSFVEYDTDIFDGKSKAYIEGMRIVPEGEIWTRSDGARFNGFMFAPVKDIIRVLTDVAIAYLPDDEAETVTALFPQWEPAVAYEVGDRRQYDGLLYRCVQAHTAQSDWTPDKTPALWVRTSTEEWPEWIRPTGAQDAYNKGDKVTYKGEHYISLINANVYSPEEYPAGWEKK